jgi:hypothetical protein
VPASIAARRWIAPAGLLGATLVYLVVTLDPARPTLDAAARKG